MVHEPHIDPLAPLRGGPRPFTLEASLERAAIRDRRSQVILRRAVVGLIALVLTATGLWLALYDPSPAAMTVGHVSAPTQPESSLPPLTTPSVPAVRLARPLSPQPRTISAPQPLLVDATRATPNILRSLDVDLTAYRDIRSMLGSSDRVVMVDNTTNRETCIQITCEGGDARSIVCSAPAPSPFRVTNLDGSLIFDIERANGSVAPGPYLPVRTRIGDEEVLLWYENVPDVVAKIGGTSIQPLVVGGYRTVVRRPDNSVVFRQQGGDVPWTSAVLYRINGTEVENAPIVWHSTESDQLEVSISDIPLGVYELRTSAPGNDVGRILIIVR